MKEYKIDTDSGIEFVVFGVSDAEARKVAEDILNSTSVTNVTPL